MVSLEESMNHEEIQRIKNKIDYEAKYINYINKPVKKKNKMIEFGLGIILGIIIGYIAGLLYV